MQRCQACFSSDWWPVLPSNFPPLSFPPFPLLSNATVAKWQKDFHFVLPIAATAPFSLSLLCRCLYVTAFDISVIVYIISWRDFSLILPLLPPLSFPFIVHFLLNLLTFYWLFATNFLFPGMSKLRRVPICFIVTLTPPFITGVYKDFHLVKYSFLSPVYVSIDKVIYRKSVTSSNLKFIM